jgi:membrane-bound serine protease (ClpP class)
MDNLTTGFMLIGAALLLLIAELFLTTGGVLLVIAGILDLIGLTMVFYFGDRYLGIVTLAAEALLLPMLAALMFYVWPHTPMGRRLIMKRGDQSGSTLASSPIYQELEQLRGRIGKAKSVLRPSGAVEFDGRRVDCMSEGILIEPDTWVRCIDVRSGHVIVRPIDSPDLQEFETTDFS